MEKQTFIPAFGALTPKKDIRQYKAKQTKAASAVSIPEEFELPMPDIKNQGPVGSCVAHACSEAVEYYNKLQEGNDTVFSTAYIYGNRRNCNYTGSGMYVDKALGNLCKWGDVPKSLFDINIEVPDAITKFEEKAIDLMPDGYPHRITEYFYLGTDEERKLNLLQNGPIVFSITWYNDFYVEADTYLLKRSGNGQNVGGHCMIIYGWNKNGWKFQNSWGKTWGNKGRAVLPYGTYFTSCYGIKDTITSKVNNDQIIKLQNQIKELTTTLSKKEYQIQILEQQIKDYKSDIQQITALLNQSKEEKAEYIEKLAATEKALQEVQAKYDDLIKSMEDIQILIKQLEEKEKQLKLLQDELFEIKRPFQKMPKWLATIINAILNFFSRKE